MSMAKCELTINPEVHVPDETALRCMKIMEWWLNDNPDKTIVGEKSMTTDGIKTELKIIKWGVSE